MLCDSWLAHAEALYKTKSLAPVAIAPDDVPEIQQLRRAQRFVLASDAARVVGELSVNADEDRVRTAAVAPADETWLEWTDPVLGALGVLLSSASPGEPAIAGTGIVATHTQLFGGRREVVALPILWNLPGPGEAIELVPDQEVFALFKSACPQLLDQIDFNRIGRWLVAALSLVAAPRLTKINDPDFGRLNKKRRRMGRPEFLAHREIMLSLESAKQICTSDVEQEDERVKRALHHVRAHYRLIPGGVTLVRQHWRGDPEIGTTKQRHVVRA